tara:strand:+ start:7320 stop:8198 length:879 start_codon:yes stop_codon:yes gene_type:complete
MVLALFSQEISESVNDVVQSFLSSKFSKESKFYVEKKLHDKLAFDGDLELISFNKSKDLDSSIDLLVSIGGDGTFLRTIEYVRDLNIPVMGINTGNLGFLATIKKENLDQAVEKIYNKKFKVENRSVIKVNSEEIGLPKNLFPYALNEISVVRKDTTSMINIKTSLDGNHLNSYWADGLIISTPTGSTGYSLSCGGPVISPSSGSLVLTPISPHNLNARPLVISDDTKIELSVSGREENHLLSIDSKIFTVQNQTKITIEKPNFDFKIAHFSNNNFYKTLKEKLLWGKDKRN